MPDRRRPVRGPVALLAALAVTLSVGVGLLTASTAAASAATRTEVMSAAASYARSHGYTVGIAVYDTKTGQSYGSGQHGRQFASESIIKVFIATRLLLSGRMHGSNASRAYKMITQSDDAIASAFYGSVGGDSLITWMKNHFHVPNLGYPPIRSGWWGSTRIIPDGLVRLYAKLKADRKVAPWLLNAMHHHTTYGSDGFYQAFGLPSATTNMGAKQGWGNDYDAWGSTADQNTTGFINHDRYAVAILGRGPAWSYGSKIGNMLTRTARILLPNGQFPSRQPVLTSVTSSGTTRGGTTVTLHGSELNHITAVTFGNVKALRVKRLSDFTLTAVTPAHAAGRVYVRVFTTAGSTPGNRAFFRFVAPPHITAVSPATGTEAGGTVVTITGTSLGRLTRVDLGHHLASKLVQVSSTQVKATVAAHAPGLVYVQVSTAYGASNSQLRYRYVPTPPSVTSVSPNSGPVAGRTTVRLRGTGFTPDSAVRFATGAAAKVTYVSPTELAVVSPGRPPGRVHVRVTTAKGTSAASGQNTFVYR